MKVGIVIPVMNLWNKYTEPCINSIRSVHQLRVVIVDNASIDETQGKARNLMLNKLGFYYIRNDKNMGCAYAWNQGVKDCFAKGCDYVLVANNDILFHPRAIDKLVERFEKAKGRKFIKRDENVVFAEFKEAGDTPIDVPPQNIVDESEILGMVTCMNIRGECIAPNTILEKDEKEKASVVEGEHPDFSGFMINRLCWNKVGEFDEGFFPAYWEDNDYHTRLNLAGLRAITHPMALFYHYGSRTSNENKISESLNSVNFERNKSYFMTKWGGLQGDPRFKNPFNDSAKSIKWTKQSPV